MGTIYLGWGTPTEAAAIGVIGASIIALFKKRFTLNVVLESLEGAARKTGMIIIIIVSAYYLNFILSSVGLSQDIQNLVAGSGSGKYTILLTIIGIYLVLGCFIETLSLMVITIPILIPVIRTVGIDPVWFGIFVILLIEMALITPPIGLNLYIVQGVREKGKISDVMLGVIPYVAVMFAFAFVLILFPELALWLPSVL